MCMQARQREVAATERLFAEHKATSIDLMKSQVLAALLKKLSKHRRLDVYVIGCYRMASK